MKVKPAVKDRSPPQFWLWEALQLYDPPSRAGNAGGGWWLHWQCNRAQFA